MAAFIRRAKVLPGYIERIPMGEQGAMSCSKDGERCTLTVDLSAGRWRWSGDLVQTSTITVRASG